MFGITEMALLLLTALGCQHTVDGALYQDFTYPYGDGELTVATKTYNPNLLPFNPPPMNTKVYFPHEPGDYAIFYFITGLGGIAPTHLYDDMMHNISSHGYVVFDTWAIVSDEGLDLENLLPQMHLQNLDWLEANVGTDLGDAVASFSDVTVGCHSSGCEFTLHMAINRTEQIKSLLNLEPVAATINHLQPEHFLPAFNLGSEIAKTYNSCSVPGYDFETWHSALDCPRIMIETADVGHCDFLDYEWWLGCTGDAVDFCMGGAADNVAPYRSLVAGFCSAFMTAYVQGNVAQLEYVSNRDLIPWPLIQHQSDVVC